MDFVRDCWGSMRALPGGTRGPVLAWGCLCRDGAGAPRRVCPGPPWPSQPSVCASSTPGPGQEGPSQGSPSRPPSPWTGQEGWAGTPRAHQSLRGGWGRLWGPRMAEGHALADTGSWWESPGDVGSGHMAGVACAGEFKPQPGDRTETRWKGAQDHCGTNHQPHILAPHPRPS